MIDRIKRLVILVWDISKVVIFLALLIGMFYKIAESEFVHAILYGIICLLITQDYKFKIRIRH